MNEGTLDVRRLRYSAMDAIIREYGTRGFTDGRHEASALMASLISKTFLDTVDASETPAKEPTCPGPHVSAFDCPVHDPRRAPTPERGDAVEILEGWARRATIPDDDVLILRNDLFHAIASIREERAESAAFKRAADDLAKHQAHTWDKLRAAEVRIEKARASLTDRYGKRCDACNHGICIALRALEGP